MSKRAWMPLYVGDYLADTGHLNTTQHGAYLLLMMHYWKKGELPDDDKQLAAITKLPLRLWLDSKETLQAFFDHGWHHKRIDEELGKMQVAADKRAAAGQKGGLKASLNRTIMSSRASSNATAGLYHSHSPSIKPSTTVPVERERLGNGKEERPPLAASPELAEILARKARA